MTCTRSLVSIESNRETPIERVVGTYIGVLPQTSVYGIRREIDDLDLARIIACCKVRSTRMDRKLIDLIVVVAHRGGGIRFAQDHLLVASIELEYLMIERICQHSRRASSFVGEAFAVRTDDPAAMNTRCDSVGCRHTDVIYTIQSTESIDHCSRIDRTADEDEILQVG